MTDLESWIVRQAKRVPEPEVGDRTAMLVAAFMLFCWGVAGLEWWLN